MEREALKLALEVNESMKDVLKQVNELIAENKALKEALAQPAQEPVAVWELFEDGWESIADPDWMKTLPFGTKLYTAQPQRPGVGLTDEERNYIWNTVGNSDSHGDVDGRSGRDVMSAIEAKLKEKNNGT